MRKNNRENTHRFEIGSDKDLNALTSETKKNIDLFV